MKTTRLTGCLLGFGALLAVVARADLVQPVSIQLTEQEPGIYLVQWQVPSNYPVQALPSPVLPESCRPRGEQTVQERPNAWLLRRLHQCAEGIAGFEVGVRYPILVAGQSTMLRVDLLSGERLVHALPPGEETWRVPQLDTGFAGDPWAGVHRAVLDGGRHFVAGWQHWALWLAIALLGRAAKPWRLATVFAAGQLVAIGVGTTGGRALPTVLAEAGIAIAVVVLAAQALTTRGGSPDFHHGPARPALDGARLAGVPGVVAIAGLLHGLGLPELLPPPPSLAAIGWLYLLLTVVGMDAVLLGLLWASAGFAQRLAARPRSPLPGRGLAYALGSIAVAGALTLVLSSPGVEAGATVGGSRLPAFAGAAGGGMPGSRRLAPQSADAPLQSFVVIEAFEVRHQILVRLRDVAAELQVGSSEVEVEAQPEIKLGLQEMVVPRVRVAIDGVEAKPLIDRIDFLTIDSRGVLARAQPRPEVVEEAWVGLTVVYATQRTPQEVELSWERFVAGVAEIPTTISDPEVSRAVVLSLEQPRIVWTNQLSEDPAPTVAAIAVEPPAIPLPLAALPLLLAAGLFPVFGLRGRTAGLRFSVARLLVALALVAAPLAEVAVALPAAVGSVPSTGEARRILSGVLPNVYRAFEFRDEATAYDRLAVSVTGDTLTEIYLEHRQALEMEERGGARARVVTVEVPEVRSVRAGEDGGFEAEAIWIVGGSVTHFGHRHFRQNRYDARVTMAPIAGQWKIRAIELLDEKRLR